MRNTDIQSLAGFSDYKVGSSPPITLRQHYNFCIICYEKRNNPPRHGRQSKQSLVSLVKS